MPEINFAPKPDISETIFPDIPVPINNEIHNPYIPDLLYLPGAFPPTCRYSYLQLRL